MITGLEGRQQRLYRGAAASGATAGETWKLGLHGAKSRSDLGIY